MKWKVEFKRIDYQNRWVKCITEGKVIIMDVENYTDEFINRLIKFQNDSVSKAYEDGINEGVRIVKDIMEIE